MDAVATHAAARYADERSRAHCRGPGRAGRPDQPGTATITSDALTMATTSVPSDRPSSFAASTVTEATSRTPPASITTFAIASPLVMLVTVALIWLRALSRMAQL